MEKTCWLSSFDSLFNMYREDTSTLTHSFNLNDPHMQMSYIWARMMLKRPPVHDRFNGTQFCMPFNPYTAIVVFNLFITKLNHMQLLRIKSLLKHEDFQMWNKYE